MKVHKSITTDRVLTAVHESYSGLSNPGFCIRCGDEASHCEPDLEGGECEACGARAVCGAEQLLLVVGG